MFLQINQIEQNRELFYAEYSREDSKFRSCIEIHSRLSNPTSYQQQVHSLLKLSQSDFLKCQFISDLVKDDSQEKVDH